MPAFLMPGGTKRLVVDRVFSLGGGRQLCELQGQFFSMNGQFLEDLEIANLLPEPYRTRAVKFVELYKGAKAKEMSAALVEVEEPLVENTTVSVMDVRTSEERAEG